jgi:hypothetical protein
MERALTLGAAADGGAAPADDAATVPARLLEYLASVGIRDAALRQSIANDCLARALKVSGPGTDRDLSVTAIEEAHRRVDGALARLLGLNPIRDAAKVAGARAALLMCSCNDSADFLFDGSPPGEDASRIARLLACAPMATPPEAHQEMPAQPFRFLFFKSS